MKLVDAHPDTLEPAGQWVKHGACREDADAMFPGTNGHDIEYAKAICRRCPVVERCLQWALDTGEEFGVWGGLSEGERRKLRRRAARTISIDDYAGTRPTPTTCRSLEEAWEDGTQADGDHLLWVGPKVIYRPRPQTQVTPNRLAFYVDRGRWPEGDVKRTCGVDGCVLPSHLTDRRERSETAMAEANTDADNRLRRTGTTKAYA